MSGSTGSYAHTASDYRVGIICALPVEMAAIESTLDDKHPKIPNAPGDENQYILGLIGQHNVAITCLPSGSLGNGPAANVAANMRRSFPIIFGLMVGIGGGVWSPQNDVRLGDVVVGKPDGQHGGVVQWDFGKTTTGGVSHRTGSLNKPPKPLRNALSSLESRHWINENAISTNLSMIYAKTDRTREHFGFPGIDQDLLFEATYPHQGNSDCQHCDASRAITYGVIASGNQKIKDSMLRDKIVKDLGGVLCFEMEAAGLDDFPCLVIRGICDYADSHKNKQWQPYASATAAAFAKEFLGFVDKQEMVERQPSNQSFTQLHPVTGKSKDTNAAEFLAALNLLSARLPRFPSHNAEAADLIDKQELEWFFNSPEFTQWKRESELLWLSGIPGSGKTTLSFCLWDSIIRDSPFTTDEEIVIFLCSPMLDSKATPESQAAQILSTIILQLLNSNPTRRELVVQQCPIPTLSRQSTRRPYPPAFLKGLWRILQVSIVAVPTRQVTLIIDGIEELRTEEIRRAFCKSLVFLQTKVASQCICDFRIFVTSRPFNDIKEAFTGVLTIEKDKERQRELISTLDAYLCLLNPRVPSGFEV